MPKDNIDFEFVVNSISEGVFTVDSEFNITTFNNAASHITGYTKQEVLEQKCFEIFKSSHCCGGNCLMRKVVEFGEKGYSTDVVVVNKNGDLIPVEISVMPLFDTNGNIIGGLEILADQRKLQQIQEKLYGRFSFQSIISKDQKMQEIFEMIEAVAPYRSSVLIYGESGTGKELVAKAIHFLSDRRYKPFIKINSATLTSTLIESELFGHEKGSFTGASAAHQGKFELADQGTIFLDEIGEIPINIQAKLLRVLQEGEFERVGGNKTIKTDARVIAATNRDLVEEIKKGNFRMDLFYRLNVFPIKVPPLRRKKNDIPLLLTYFLKKYNAFFQKAKKGVSEEAMDFLLQYDYPGNIREMENAIEYAFIKGKSDYILLKDLPPNMIADTKLPDRFTKLDDIEKQHIEKILESCNGNRDKATELLGISRKTLYNKIKKYHL